jgi:hypothetical protein
MADLVDPGSASSTRLASGPYGAPPAPAEPLRQYVEEFAMLLEREGLPRMAGRIFVHLLTCEPPERTAAQLAADLHASVGSISPMARLLVSAELIERVSRPGVRADLYRVTPEGITSLMRGAVARIVRFRRMTERGLALLADRPPPSRERLHEINDLYGYFETALPALVSNWEHRRKESVQ